MLRLSRFKIINFFIIYIITCCAQMPLCWQQWGEQYQAAPKKIWYPENLEQVRAIILLARERNMSIRCIGSAHSWSNLLATDGYIITTDNFNKILAIDQKKLQVRVEAGIKIKDLIKILAQHNLALSNQGFISEQSIAGAIATATHGTGKTGSLSSFITGVELMDSRGILHTITNDSQSELLPAARMHLGALGFIYAVTIQCEPLFILQHWREIITWQDLLDNYEKLYNSHDYFMAIGHPTNNTVLAYFWDRVTSRQTSYNFFTHLPEKLSMNYTVHALGAPLVNYMTKFGTVSMELLLRLLRKKKHLEYSYISLSPLKTPVGVNYYIEEELAIDIKKFPEALEKLRTLYSNYQKRAGHLIGIITCRFVCAENDCYLSPACGRETAYITVNIINYFKEYQEFFADFEALMEPYGARPHWGKFHSLNGNKIKNLYAANFDKFNNARKLLDPDGLFLNNLLKSCFSE